MVNGEWRKSLTTEMPQGTLSGSAIHLVPQGTLSGSAIHLVPQGAFSGFAIHLGTKETNHWYITPSIIAFLRELCVLRGESP